MNKTTVKNFDAFYFLREFRINTSPNQKNDGEKKKRDVLRVEGAARTDWGLSGGNRHAGHLPSDPIDVGGQTGEDARMSHLTALMDFGQDSHLE